MASIARHIADSRSYSALPPSAMDSQLPQRSRSALGYSWLPRQKIQMNPRILPHGGLESHFETNRDLLHRSSVKASASTRRREMAGRSPAKAGLTIMVKPSEATTAPAPVAPSFPSAQMVGARANRGQKASVDLLAMDSPTLPNRPVIQEEPFGNRRQESISFATFYNTGFDDADEISAAIEEAIPPPTPTATVAKRSPPALITLQKIILQSPSLEGPPTPKPTLIPTSKYNPESPVSHSPGGLLMKASPRPWDTKAIDKTHGQDSFAEIPRGFYPEQASQSIKRDELSRLKRHARKKVEKYEVLQMIDVDTLSKELRNINERVIQLRTTCKSLRAGRRDLQNKIRQYLEACRSSTFSVEYLLEYENALATLDTTLEDQSRRLERFQYRGLRVRQKLLEHLAATSLLSAVGYPDTLVALSSPQDSQDEDQIAELSTPPGSPSSSKTVTARSASVSVPTTTSTSTSTSNGARRPSLPIGKSSPPLPGDAQAFPSKKVLLDHPLSEQEPLAASLRDRLLLTSRMPPTPPPQTLNTPPPRSYTPSTNSNTVADTRTVTAPAQSAPLPPPPGPLSHSVRTSIAESIRIYAGNEVYADHNRPRRPLSILPEVTVGAPSAPSVTPTAPPRPPPPPPLAPQLMSKIYEATVGYSDFTYTRHQ